MKRSSLAVQLVVVTLVALAIAFFFAIYPMLVAIFMMSRPGWTDADMIRQIWHFRLVQPEWISSPNQFESWWKAEVYTRLSVVFVAWLASVIALVRRYLRGKRGHLTNRFSQPLTGEKICT